MIQVRNLQTLFSDYIKECRYSSRLRPETLRGYTEVFRHFSVMMPEVTEIRHLTTDMMTEFFKRMQTRERVVGKGTIKTGIKNSTVKTYWSKLNSFFEWLHKKMLVDENPLKNIKPPQPVYDDDRALKKEDLHKIITAISLHSPNPLTFKRDMAMISLLIFCGLRKGEFISLHIRDVDFEKELLAVRGETSKSKKTRYIPMNPTLVMHLKEYIKERNARGYKSEYLIVSTIQDIGLSCHGLKHWVHRLIRLSGVQFHLHRFRHSFAVNLAMQNTGTTKIQKLMGHVDPRMTQTYLRSLTTEDLRDDVNRLNFDTMV